jgi:hypothetical protein
MKTHTEKAAKYTNALPLSLREFESINLFACFEITILVNAKLINKFIDKLSKDSKPINA